MNRAETAAVLMAEEGAIAIPEPGAAPEVSEAEETGEEAESEE